MDVQTLHQQYCALQTNYQSVLQKLSTLRSSVSAQALEINDLIGDLANIQKQIDDLNGTDCSRLTPTTTAGALIVCDGGIQKTLTAPANDGFSLVSSGGFWKAVTSGQTWKAAPANLFTDVGATNVAVTFPGYPTGSKDKVSAVFLSGLFVTNGVGQGQLLLNGETLNFKRAFGSNGDGNYMYSIAEINPTETFNIVSTGGGVLNCDLLLIGYLSNVI